MANRQFDDNFWRDAYIAELATDEKMLFSYCITNPCLNIYGIYEIPLRLIALDTGIPKDRVLTIIEKLSRDGKISYHNEKYIIIHNWHKYQSYNLKDVRDYI